MLNKIFLQGRLVADPELRHTPSGAAVASFRLAVDRDFKSKDTGEKKTDFINIVAWRQTAEFISRYFSKGRMAVVEGRLQIRDYTDKEGAKRTIAEVVADNVYFGDSRRDNDQGHTGGSYAPAPSGYAPQNPYGNTNAGGAYQLTPAVDQFAELSDDGELPF